MHVWVAAPSRQAFQRFRWPPVTDIRLKTSTCLTAPYSPDQNRVLRYNHPKKCCVFVSNQPVSQSVTMTSNISRLFIFTCEPKGAAVMTWLYRYCDAGECKLFTQSDCLLQSSYA